MPRPIHLYRPQRTAPEDLEKIFTGRESLLDEILTQLRQFQPGRSRQHHLIIGPRGIGKTAVLRVLEHRVRGTDAGGKWVALFLAEDNYALTSVADLFVEALRILSVNESDRRVEETYQQVRHDDSNDRVLDKTLDAFRNFHSSSGKNVLLMLENVNRVFERQIRHRGEIRLLRKLLMEEEWLLFVCTSPTFLSSVTEPEEPLFEFFRLTPLAELSLQEQETMLSRLADLEGNRRFEDYLKKYRSRLRALYHFTGGNPRLSIMLYKLVSHQAITDVQSELDLLLDDLTPFYQDRMRDMSDQEGKLLETMALLPEGCTPSELAKEARMEAKTVRALISRLVRAGYLRREQRRLKKTIYIIPERFFRIWHQMNHSRVTRGRLRYLLEFFSTWYATRAERDQVWSELTQEFERGDEAGDDGRLDDVMQYRAYVAAVSEGGERYKRELEHALHTAALPGGEPLEKCLARLDAAYAQDGDYFLQKGYLLANEMGRHAEALDAFQRSLELKRGTVEPVFNKAVALDKLGHDSQARVFYRRAAALLAAEGEDVEDARLRGALLEVLRHDHDLQRVRLAAYLLGRVYEESAWKEIVVVLRESSSSWRKRRCATVLGFTRAAASLPELIVCLGDDAPEVRGSAATALGRIGAKEAVQHLIGSLQDPDAITRGSAATALGRIGAKEAVQHLLDSLQDPAAKVRGSATTALGRIGAEEAIQHLIDALPDPAADVRGSAATALGRIGAKEAVQHLIGSLQDPAPNVRGSAAAALGRISLTHTIPELGRVFWLLIESLGQVPEDVLNVLIESLLRSCLRSRNLKLLEEILTEISRRLPDSSVFCLPYKIAAEYLKSGRNPAVLERQHPEMREAAQLVIEAFEEAA